MSSDIRDFYRNKNVLVTGATGFLGKIIVEKLLRTCDVGGIYLIVRPKKGLCPDERLRNLLEEQVFEKVKVMDINATKKIYIIEGDLSKKGLGLSKDDTELIQSIINVVFHCGASLNMDSKLADAVTTNVKGTAEILEIMKEVKNLHAFVLVSTAYSNCYERRIEERFYEPPIDPDLLIRMTEDLNEHILASISPGLIGIWPNSYVYSKAIAENLLLTKGKNLPVGLFRPAIVTSTVSEPVPGWSDNLYGPLGILLSSHCGILRVVRANGDIKSHTVPGDMCINALLCLAWDISQRWKTTSENYYPPVLNFSAKGSKLLIPMKQYVDCKKIDYIPFKRAMWYQMLFLVKTKYNYLIVKFLLHTVPAYLIDSMLIIFCRKPRVKKLYTKLEKISDVLYYFLINEWDIENDNVLKLWEKLKENDKITFNFDINTIDMDNYFKNLLIGLKKYVLKEDMTKCKFHMKRYKRLMLLHFTFKYSLLGFSAYSIFKGVSKLLATKER
ncbi:fatty acyl-CoA reductase wat-like [Anoplophora glabripennis]|uniref:fatty acyl-CoA reductase wat-like n=1 Tax=Anoplophora glabripennis TaxID=217634 RepID=UPI000874AE9E|nr:fatty acyl-CoA reductase wat-like [Anoplophora glabripennis]